MELWLQADYSSLMWVLGPELRSIVRAICLYSQSLSHLSAPISSKLKYYSLERSSKVVVSSKGRLKIQAVNNSQVSEVPEFYQAHSASLLKVITAEEKDSDILSCL